MTRLPRRSNPAGPRLASIENLLAAAVALGLFFITVNVAEYGSTYYDFRLIVLGISAGATSLAFMSALARRRTKADTLAVLAILYFAWAAIQDLTQSGIPSVALDLVGASAAYAATRANLRGVLPGLRRWILVAVIACLLPAFLGQGFRAGRVWFGLAPGRYFGFSNPDGLGFIAGLALLLSLPILRLARGRILAIVGGFLFVIAATYTAAIAAGLAVVSYYFVAKGRATRHLQWGAAGLAVITVGALVWMPTRQGMDAFDSLSQRMSLSGRTVLWFELLRIARDAGYFWTGLGGRVVGRYTVEILGVGTAHATILQLLLSKGFVTTAIFVLIAAIAANRTLGRISSKPSRDERLAFAILVYWFVTSLVSTEPGTPFGLMLVFLIAVSRSDDELEADRPNIASLDASRAGPVPGPRGSRVSAGEE